jgi:hypothetical protein
MSNSHESHRDNAGTKSGIWVIVLVVVLLALLSVPVLLALGLVGFFTLSRVEVAPAELSASGATATLTTNGVTITAVAESGQWRTSQITSSGSRVEARLDTQTIVVKNSQLSINNVEYGAVQPGDEVRFEGGRVTVNGQQRNPPGGPAASPAASKPVQATAEQGP